MSEMVERVAQAIVDEITAQTGTPPIRDAAFAAMATKVARIAIAAMREPTDAMITAGAFKRENRKPVTDVWGAMIDAALAPQK